MIKYYLKSLFYYYLALFSYILIIIMCLSIILIPIWLVLQDNFEWWENPLSVANEKILDGE